MSDVLLRPGQEDLVARLIDLHGAYMHATKLAEARRNLIPFCHHMMQDFRSPAHIRAIADLLERAERGEVSRILITMPPRHGKPVYAGSMILMADGSRKSLGDVVVGDQVITHEGRARLVSAVHEQGMLPVVTIRTELGRETIAALDHPFLTTDGWKDAGDLKPGDVLAMVPEPRTESTGPRRPLAEFLMAGYFIGDGNTNMGPNVTSPACNITNTDPGVVRDFTEAAQYLGWIVVPRLARTSVEFMRYDFKGTSRATGPRRWLMSNEGMIGTSWTKRVPSWVFQASREEIGAFLGAYFACDGHINHRGGAREDCCLEFYSVNKPLLQDVQHLLLRLGVRARLTSKNGLDQHKQPHKSFRLAITSMDDVAQLRDHIRLVGDKAERLAKWPLRRTRFPAKYLSDEVVSVEQTGEMPCRCLTVEEDHTFTSDDLVVHNSRIISNLFPAWYFGRNPGSEVIFTTYNQDLAEDNGRYVKNVISTSEFREVFPDVRIRNDSASARRFSTYQKGNYFAVGVGGPLTGRGARILLIDDPLKNREEAESPSIRQALIDWYTSTAYTRLAPAGVVVIVQTRWHQEDLAGVVLQQEHEGWVHLDLPAILDARSAAFLDRNVGEALWPEQFDLATLLRTKKSVPARDWASLYMQSPISEGGNIVKRESVKDWTDPEPPYCDFIIASFDTAFGTKAQNDPTACTVWGLFHDANNVRHAILLDAKQQRVEFPELKKWIIDCDERHKPDIILVENKASGQSLLQEMRRLQVPVQAYNPGRQDKVARLEACTPLFENGKVWAPMNRDYVQEWIEQLVTFPAAKHDDLVDSTTAALQRLRRFGDLTTSDDYEPDEDDAADDNRAASYW